MGRHGSEKAGIVQWLRRGAVVALSASRAVAAALVKNRAERLACARSPRHARDRLGLAEPAQRDSGGLCSTRHEPRVRAPPALHAPLQARLVTSDLDLRLRPPPRLF